MRQQPNNRLKGQSAIVTGSSSGIGQAIAIGLAIDGTNVLINYHSDEEGAQETAAEIKHW